MSVPKTKMKAWLNCTKPQKADKEFLRSQVTAYEESLDDVDNNKDYIKFVDALYDLEQAEAKKTEAEAKKSGKRPSPADMNEDEKRVLACEILNPNYRIGFGKDGTKMMLEIVDFDKKLVKAVDNKAAIDDQIEKAIADKIVSAGITFSPFHVRELSQYWKLYGEKLPANLVTYAGFDTEAWAFGRAKIHPASGEMPTWTHFLARMNDPEAFAAWIYGVASKRYVGRQVMWLHGENGEDGKSFIQKRIIDQLFDNVTAAMDNSALGEGAARFLRAEFENKALAFWDDCNNTMALMREDIKQLSSGEEGNPTRIEKKGKQAYTAQLETRLWINSNFAPVVPSDNYVRSRLLYIHLDAMEDKPDAAIGPKFVKEMPAFLEYGRKCFEKLCVDGRAIQQNKTANTEINELVMDHDDKYKAIFDRRFRKDKAANVKTSTVGEILAAEKLSSPFAKSQFYSWLEKTHGLVKKKVNDVQVIPGLAANVIGGGRAYDYET